jgi:hypothetical protein
MKKRISFFFSKYNSFFEKRSSLLIFLLLVLGVLIPTLSGSPTYNFWYKLFTILTSPFFNMMFFLAIGINVIYISSEFSKSYNIINRYTSYRKLVKNFIGDIVFTTIILLLVASILSIAGAVLLSFGDLSMINHPYYNIPMLFYIIFYIVRSCIFACIINAVVYQLLIILKDFATIILFLIINSLFMLLPNGILEISHFYNMPLLYHYYFSSVQYSSLFLEMICSSLEFLILLIIYKLFFKIVTLKKRDLT